MKLEFKINKYYLVGHAMASKNKPFPAWKKLEEKIWQKYKEEPAYYFLNPKHVNWAVDQIKFKFLNSNIQFVFQKKALQLEKIYRDVFKTKEFKRLYKETEKYLKFLKKQWESKQKEALNLLSEISGIQIPREEKINVFITHPKLYNGRILIKEKIILWGHPEDWNNYSVVYLCHELMHIFTWKKQINENIMHALIELTTDEELRIRLNRKGEYFKEYKIIGHKHLKNLKKKILPFWKKFLKEKKFKNIFELEEFLIKKGHLKDAPPKLRLRSAI